MTKEVKAETTKEEKEVKEERAKALQEKEVKEERAKALQEKEVKEERAKALQEEETWKMRALVSAQENIAVKMELLKSQSLLLQKEKTELDKDIQQFQADMQGKYGVDAQALPSGELQYLPPQMPPAK
ncbi:MAG: hypothetical protein KAX49_17225 [Halanaerobiales bacterium]|nr:hypothetical protein [Halanaerobiales bacterium]